MKPQLKQRFVAGWKRFLYTGPAPDETRRNLRRVWESMILHIHPTRVPAKALTFTYTWGLGGISTLLCLTLAVTGILLMFRYDSDVERAYLSIQALETEVLFGSLIRALHHWSANLLAITAFLHMLRVFFTGGFKAGRKLNWVIGVVLFVLVLAFNFTGYLLPWDQVAYWAITITTTVIQHIPAIGREISNAVLAGSEVGQGALRNFYALHVAVLPATVIILLGYHFWRVRKDGGISQPLPRDGEEIEKLTTVPHLVRRETAVAAAVITLLILFSMLVPAPLGGVADPLRSPNPAKAAWYLGGFQELLLHMETEAAMVFMALVFAGVIAVPILDRQDDNIGLACRSRTGVYAALLGLALAINLVPALIVADEYYINWVAWFPNWPSLLANGFLPIVGLLVLLGLVYGIARRLLKANRSEGLVALFSFLMTSFVVLTIVCAFFRGANMDLVLPGGL